MKKIFLIPIFPFILNATTLKIATYNVDNLFDAVDNGTEYSDYKLNRHNWNIVTFHKKLEHITRVICDLNADVVALEEVENSNALQLLQKSLNRAGCKYPFAALTHKRGSAIQVALLSKVDFVHKRDIKVGDASYRDILEVTLKTDPKLTIFANHWSSKRSQESTRLRSAKALMQRIEKMPKGSEYIILGDFNSEYNECSNLNPKYNDTNGVCGIDTILKTYSNGKMIKLRDKSTPKDSIFHYNLWGDMAPHKRWSYRFYGKKGAIDSIIIPPTLNDRVQWFYKPKSFGVFKKSYLFQKKKHSMLNRWEYKNGKHTGHGYSDHLPVYATFTTSDKKELKHETLLDKFWKLFIPKVKEKEGVAATSSEVSLDTLAKMTYLKKPVVVKDACVVFKRGDTAVVKSSPTSKAVTLYKSAEGMHEGSCYDLKVYKVKRYYKIGEILDLDILKKSKTVDSEKFIAPFSPNLMDESRSNIGDIVKNIQGVYRDHYLYIDNAKYRIFVKQKRKGLLKKGSHLSIAKAQIGYYKGEKELIIYSLKDIKKEN